MLTVLPYQSQHYTAWNSFVAQAKNATFLFHRDYMEYHGNRFVDASVLLYKGSRLIAVFPGHQIDKEVYSHEGLSYGGLLCVKTMRLELYLECFNALLEFWDRRSIDFLYIKAIPRIYQQVFSDEIEYACFLVDAELYRRDTLSVVDLADRLPLSTNRKRAINAGFKHEVYVEENGDFKSFWQQVLIPNLRERYQVEPVHSLEEIQLLHRSFPKQIRQFNAYLASGQIIAGVTVFDTPKVAHLQYISGLATHNKKGGLDWLHSYLLDVVFADKAYFDFGNSNASQGQQINKGLLYWKEGFGARTVVQNFYAIPVKNHLKLKQLWI